MPFKLSIQIRDKFRERLIKSEGLRKFPYGDIKGNLTIGVGRNLKSKGISKYEALFLLNNDITEAENLAELYCPWIEKLNDARKTVILDMIFNLGIASFLQFKDLIESCKKGDYKSAARSIRNSLYARQVGKRAETLAIIMEKGTF